MRWGVRDEATDDHMTTELCMKEIENCQRLSMGPNFVVSQKHLHYHRIGGELSVSLLPNIIPFDCYYLLFATVRQ